MTASNHDAALMATAQASGYLRFPTSSATGTSITRGETLVSSPYLTTAEAAHYLRFRSSSAIRNLKLRGALSPIGRRGHADLYLRSDLDRFVQRGSSATIGDGRPDAPGNGHAHDELECRREADQVPGHLQNGERLPRTRARGGSEDRYAEGEEPRVRRDRSRRGASATATTSNGDPQSCGAGIRAGQVRRLRDALAEIENGKG